MGRHYRKHRGYRFHRRSTARLDDNRSRMSLRSRQAGRLHQSLRQKQQKRLSRSIADNNEYPDPDIPSHRAAERIIISGVLYNRSFYDNASLSAECALLCKAHVQRRHTQLYRRRGSGKRKDLRSYGHAVRHMDDRILRHGPGADHQHTLRPRHTGLYERPPRKGSLRIQTL